MNLAEAMKISVINLGKWFNKNSAEIYKAAAYVGLVSSVSLMAKESIDAYNEINALRYEKAKNGDEETKFQQVASEGKIIIKKCGPALLTTAFTGVCIHNVYSEQNKKILAATLAGNIYKQSYKELETKMEKYLGKEKTEEVKKEIKEDHIKEEIEKKPSILDDIPEGDVLMWDDVSKQYFYSNSDKLSLATKDILNRIYNYNEMYITFNEILDELGEKTLGDYADRVGCDTSTGFVIDKSTHQIDEDHACISISYMIYDIMT